MHEKFNQDKSNSVDVEQPVISIKMSVLVLSLFFGISLLLMFFHEPWRDEAQAWLVARDAPNYKAMLSSMGYEGTPGLWHTLLFPLTKLNIPYKSMQILNLIIIFTAVVLFLRFSPFTRPIKILFPFGYFILYEYNAIARNYALSILFLFLIATLYWKKMRTSAYPLLLFFLANTNLLGLVISVVLFVDYCLEYLRTIKRGRNTVTDSSSQKILEKNSLKVIVTIIVLAVSFLIPIITLLPPADAERGFHVDLSMPRIGGAASSVISAYLPLPEFQQTFWNTRLFYFTSPWIILLILPLFMIPLLLLWSSRKAFILYFFSFIGLFAIFFFISIGTLRHHGFIFILFIFCSWIALTSRQHSTKNFQVLNLFLGFILLIHMFAAGTAIYYELNYHFSNSKEAAFFLNEKGLLDNDTIIATYRSVLTSSLVPYLPKGYRFYCVERGEYCSRFNGKNETFDLQYLNDNLRYFENIPRQNHILLLTHPDYIKSLPNQDQYGLIASFEGAISHEDYYLYRMNSS